MISLARRLEPSLENEDFADAGRRLDRRSDNVFRRTGSGQTMWPGCRSGSRPGREADPPGTEQQMRPAPDHGEASYRRSGRLAGKAAVVTGADSGIGNAVAIAFCTGIFEGR